jgi:hypothetical protein
MSFRKSLLALAALPLALGGCGVLGLGSPAGTPGPSPSATPNPGDSPWIVTVPGAATPSPTPSRGTGTATPGLPPVSFLAVDRGCPQDWHAGAVLIPMIVTPAKGSLVLSWPRQYNSNYLVTAVPQPLVSGNQPTYTWQNVAPPASGCMVSATITGLKSGKPYIVWLDAPNTGFELDGTRHLYSGRSGVVYPL